ncbi:MAG: orotidine 5'-phosphate decarboxylase [Infirmifilum sp.]
MPRDLRDFGKNKQSWVILALDYAPRADPLSEWRALIEKTMHLLAGVKLGLPAFLRIGPDGTKQLIEEFKGKLYFLADFKLADIHEVVQEELRLIENLGFDGAIIHLFPRCIEEPLHTQLEVFGLVSMSCKESLVDHHLDELSGYASKLGLKGVVVGATKPESIKRVRKMLQDAVILSPGVGVQGAAPGSALAAGADFEIIGRSVIYSVDPLSELEKVVRAQRLVRHEG